MSGSSAHSAQKPTHDHEGVEVSHALEKFVSGIADQYDIPEDDLLHLFFDQIKSKNVDGKYKLLNTPVAVDLTTGDLSISAPIAWTRWIVPSAQHVVKVGAIVEIFDDEAEKWKPAKVTKVVRRGDKASCVLVYIDDRERQAQTAYLNVQSEYLRAANPGAAPSFEAELEEIGTGEGAQYNNRRVLPTLAGEEVQPGTEVQVYNEDLEQWVYGEVLFVENSEVRVKTAMDGRLHKYDLHSEYLQPSLRYTAKGGPLSKDTFKGHFTGLAAAQVAKFEGIIQEQRQLIAKLRADIDKLRYEIDGDDTVVLRLEKNNPVRNGIQNGLISFADHVGEESRWNTLQRIRHADYVTFVVKPSEPNAKDSPTYGQLSDLKKQADILTGACPGREWGLVQIRVFKGARQRADKLAQSIKDLEGLYDCLAVLTPSDDTVYVIVGVDSAVEFDKFLQIIAGKANLDRREAILAYGLRERDDLFSTWFARVEENLIANAAGTEIENLKLELAAQEKILRQFAEERQQTESLQTQRTLAKSEAAVKRKMKQTLKDIELLEARTRTHLLQADVTSFSRKQEQLDAKTRALNLAEDELDDLRQRMSQSTEAQARQERELSSASQDMRGLQNQLEAQGEDLRTREQQVQQVKGKWSVLQQQVGSYEHQQDKQQRAIKFLREDIEELKTEKGAAKKAVKEERGRANDLKSMNDRLESMIYSQELAFQKELDSLRKQLTGEQVQTDTLRLECGQLQTTSRDLAASNKMLHKGMDASHLANTQVNLQLDAERRQRERERNAYKKRIENHKDMQARFSQAAYTNRHGTVADKERIAELEKDKLAFQNEINRLEQLNAATRKQTVLLSKLAKVTTPTPGENIIHIIGQDYKSTQRARRALREKPPSRLSLAPLRLRPYTNRTY